MVTEEWNLLAQGRFLPAGNLIYVQLSVLKLNTHKSSMSATPYPPKITRNSEMSSATWYVLSQGETSFYLGLIQIHSLVSQSKILIELNLCLLAPPPPKITICLFCVSQFIVQFDLWRGISPKVSIYRHFIVTELKVHKSFMQLESAYPPKNTIYSPITQLL